MFSPSIHFMPAIFDQNNKKKIFEESFFMESIIDLWFGIKSHRVKAEFPIIVRVFLYATVLIHPKIVCVRHPYFLFPSYGTGNQHNF